MTAGDHDESRHRAQTLGSPSTVGLDPSTVGLDLSTEKEKEAGEAGSVDADDASGVADLEHSEEQDEEGDDQEQTQVQQHGWPSKPPARLRSAASQNQSLLGGRQDPLLLPLGQARA